MHLSTINTCKFVDLKIYCKSINIIIEETNVASNVSSSVSQCITRVPIECQYAALQNVGPYPGNYSGFMATTDCAVVVITIIIITIIIRNGNNNIIEPWYGNGVGRSKNGGLTAAREMRQ